MSAPASNWRRAGARNKACQRARDLLELAAGWLQATPAQQVQMKAVVHATINALYAGYTQGQQAVQFASVRGAVAAAAAGGLVVPEYLLPRGAANFLRNQGILAGWGPVAQPLPAAAMPPPPPGWVPLAAQAAQAPAPATAAPAAAGAVAPAPADDDDDEDEEGEEGDEEEDEEEDEDDEDDDEDDEDDEEEDEE